MSKLKLSKTTIASLNKDEMQKVHGGICIASTKRKCKIQIGGSAYSYREDNPGCSPNDTDQFAD